MFEAIVSSCLVLEIFNGKLFSFVSSYFFYSSREGGRVGLDGHPRPRRDQHPLGLGRRDPSKIREKNLHSAAGGTRQSSGNRWFLSADIYGTTCLPPGLCSLLLIIDSVFQSYYLRWFKSAQEWLTKLSFIIQLPTVSVIIFA